MFVQPPTVLFRLSTDHRPFKCKMAVSENKVRITRPELAREDVVYNVAIGSNMDGTKLRSREVGNNRRICPLSDGVPCHVPGWALSFDFVVLPPIEPVMCGAIQRDGEELHGVLWKLKREDYEFLASTEDCMNPYSTYIEHEVLAIPYHGGEPVQALIFALRSSKPAPALLYPSVRYKKLMVEGSRMAKLDSKVLQRLAQVPTARPCASVMRGYSLFALIAIIAMFKRNLVLPFLNQLYRPLLGDLYSRREQALVQGKLLKSMTWTGIMLLVMMPMVMFGFLHAWLRGDDVLKIASGEGVL